MSRPVPAVAAWPTLFSPFALRGHQIRNRITSTPHATGWGSGGIIAGAEVDYQVRKARGGCGLVMTFGSASVDPDSAASYGSVSLWDPRNDGELRRLAHEAHEHGAVVMSQMTHMGRRGSSRLSGIPLRGASDLPEGVHREVPVILRPTELTAIAHQFADAAARLERLGWDGAEVTSFGGHLIEQFFDPAVNTRTDGYGGSLANRVRFAREVLTAVREATSTRFVLGFRVTADQHLPAGMTTQDLLEVVVALTDGGLVDLLSVSGGTGATTRSSSFFVPADEVPENANGALAGSMGRATGIPVIAAGRILSADRAESALTESGVDLVAMTRALIADPDLPRTLAEGGRARPCISLSEGCIGRLYQGMPMACSINPAIQHPELDDHGPGGESDPPGRPQPAHHLVVVGGGVAGAEAARRAARGGRRVTLLEAGERLGGRARLAGLRRGRERWELYLDWLTEDLDRAGVEVKVGTDADATAVLALAPDEVLLATGSQARLPAASGGVEVRDADDVLAVPPTPFGSHTALVLDEEGGFVAPTAAEALRVAGWSVTIVTDLPHVAANVDPTQIWFVRRRLKLAGVALRGSTELRPRDVGWELVDTESDEVSPVGALDLIAVAGRRSAQDQLAVELQRLSPELSVSRVGDALSPRTLLDAVVEGARAGAVPPTSITAALEPGPLAPAPLDPARIAASTRPLVDPR